MKSRERASRDFDVQHSGLEEPRDRAVLTQKWDKTQELMQHLSKTASFLPRSFSHLLDDFGLGAPK